MAILEIEGVSVKYGTAIEDLWSNRLCPQACPICGKKLVRCAGPSDLYWQHAHAQKCVLKRAQLYQPWIHNVQM